MGALLLLIGSGCQALTEATNPPRAAHHRIPLPLQEAQYRAIAGPEATSFRNSQIAHLREPAPPKPPRVVVRTWIHWTDYYPYFPTHPYYWGRRGFWPRYFSRGTLVP